MTVRSVEQGTERSVLKVGLEDGSCFFIRTAYLPPDSPVPRPDLELDAAAIAALREAGACFRAERDALKLIARSEQWTLGLRLKLRRKEHAEPCIDRALEHLAGTGLLDDERYCRLWLGARIRTHAEGRIVLAARLAAKGMDRAAAARALDAVLEGDAELDLLRRFLDRKRISLSALGAAERQAIRKAGFSSSLLRRCIDDAQN